MAKVPSKESMTTKIKVMTKTTPCWRDFCARQARWQAIIDKWFMVDGCITKSPIAYCVTILLRRRTVVV